MIIRKTSKPRHFNSHRIKGLTPEITLDFNNIAKKLEDLTGYTIFSKSRKREIIDVRRVFTVVVCNKYKIGEEYSKRENHFITYDDLKEYLDVDTHSTLINLRRDFEVIRTNSPYVNKLYTECLSEFSTIESKISNREKEIDRLTKSIKDLQTEIKFLKAKKIEDDEKAEEDYRKALLQR